MSKKTTPKPTDSSAVREVAIEFLEEAKRSSMTQGQVLQESVASVLSQIGANRSIAAWVASKASEAAAREASRRQAEYNDLIVGVSVTGDSPLSLFICSICRKPLKGIPFGWVDPDGNGRCSSPSGAHQPEAVKA